MISKDDIERFLAEGMYADTTKDVYRRTLLRFMEHARPASKGWEARAITFRDKHECGPHGKALYLAAVKSFLNWAVDENLIPKNPLRKVRIRISSKNVRTCLNDDSVKKLLNTLDLAVGNNEGIGRILALRDRAAIVFMLHTAMRIGGVVGLDIEDFRIDGDTAVARYKCKGHIGKDSTARVTQKPLEVIGAYLDATNRTWESTGPLWFTRRDTRIGYHGLALSIEGRFKAAGLANSAVCAHVLRHTAASKAYRGGASLKSIQDMLDHKNLATTQIYIHSLGGIENSAEGKIDYDS